MWIPTPPTLYTCLNPLLRWFGASSPRENFCLVEEVRSEVMRPCMEPDSWAGTSPCRQLNWFFISWTRALLISASGLVSRPSSCFGLEREYCTVPHTCVDSNCPVTFNRSAAWVVGLEANSTSTALSFGLQHKRMHEAARRAVRGPTAGSWSRV